MCYNQNEYLLSRKDFAEIYDPCVSGVASGQCEYAMNLLQAEKQIPQSDAEFRGNFFPESDRSRVWPRRPRQRVADPELCAPCPQGCIPRGTRPGCARGKLQLELPGWPSVSHEPSAGAKRYDSGTIRCLCVYRRVLALFPSLSARGGPVVGLAGILFLLALSPVYSAGGPGTGAANFLKIPVGARETSLGGAFTAVADNANAVYYNPAGLGLLRNPEISFTQNNFVEGISQQWLSAAYPYKTGVFGLGINYLSVPAFDSYDNSDNRTGSVSADDMAVYLSWGGSQLVDYKFLRSISYGAGVKYISEKLDTEKGTGYGLDLGCLATSAVENLRFGFSIENVVSSEIKFIEVGAKPPLKFKTGVMYGIRSAAGPTARLSLDYVFWSDRPGYIAAGMETLFLDAFAVRIGYSAFGDISNGLNFGLGFVLSKYTGRSISVDYSFGATDAFGDIHKFSVTYKFGQRRTPGLRAAPKTVPADGMKW